MLEYETWSTWTVSLRAPLHLQHVTEEEQPRALSAPLHSSALSDPHSPVSQSRREGSGERHTPALTVSSLSVWTRANTLQFWQRERPHFSIFTFESNISLTFPLFADFPSFLSEVSGEVEVWLDISLYYSTVR